MKKFEAEKTEKGRGGVEVVRERKRNNVINIKNGKKGQNKKVVTGERRKA